MTIKGKTRTAHGRLNASDKDLSRRMAAWRTDYRVTALLAGSLAGVSDNTWTKVENGKHFALPEFAATIEGVIAVPPPAAVAAPTTAPTVPHAESNGVPGWVKGQLSMLNKRLAALESVLGVPTPSEQLNKARELANSTSVVGYGG